MSQERNQRFEQFETSFLGIIKHFNVYNFGTDFNHAIYSAVTFDPNKQSNISFYGAEYGRNVDRNQDYAR